MGGDRPGSVPGPRGGASRSHRDTRGAYPDLRRVRVSHGGQPLPGLGRKGLSWSPFPEEASVLPYASPGDCPIPEKVWVRCHGDFYGYLLLRHK